MISTATIPAFDGLSEEERLRVIKSVLENIKPKETLVGVYITTIFPYFSECAIKVFTSNNEYVLLIHPFVWSKIKTDKRLIYTYNEYYGSFNIPVVEGAQADELASFVIKSAKERNHHAPIQLSL